MQWKNRGKGIGMSNTSIDFGLTTPSLLAGAASTEEEVGRVLAPEVGISNADKKQQFRDRAILIYMWKQCRANPGAILKFIVRN